MGRMSSTNILNDRHERVPALAGDRNGNARLATCGRQVPKPHPDAGIVVRGGVLFPQLPRFVVEDGGEGDPVRDREEDDSD